jgi:hypothetical protein
MSGGHDDHGHGDHGSKGGSSINLGITSMIGGFFGAASGANAVKHYIDGGGGGHHDHH